MPTLAVPTRVDADVKQALLGLLEHATGLGWPMEKACQVLGLGVRRARRWTRRQDSALGLVDARRGASVNALTPAEVAAIVKGVRNVRGERLLPPSPGVSLVVLI